MSTYAQWKPEIVDLLNAKNSSSLTVADIELELLSQDDASVTVKVTPSMGSKYYGEETVTYVRRDLAKAFLNIPLRILVSSDTTVGALLQRVAERFGIPFDTAVDFAQAELDKAVSFADAGQLQVEIPASDTSFVWVGKLTLTAVNDGLDLETIIANINLTELKYITITEPDTTSAAFQTFPVDYSGVTGLSALAVGSTLSEAQADAIVSRTQETEEVNSPADLKTALNGAEVTELLDGGALKVATVAVKPQPTYSGNAYVTYAVEAAKTWQAVMDEFGPGRAVLIGLTAAPLDSQYPIASIPTESLACSQMLDFKDDSMTAMVIPPLLKIINTVGGFGIAEADLDTIAASVTVERTTVTQIGQNVRTLRFSNTLGHPELATLLINYTAELTLYTEMGMISARRVVVDSNDVNHVMSLSGSPGSALRHHTDGVMNDSQFIGYTRNIANVATMMIGSTDGINDFTGWTVLRSVKEDFDTPTFPGKYKKEVSIMLSPEKARVALVVRAVDYEPGFQYRIADDTQVIFTMTQFVEPTSMHFVGNATSTNILTAFADDNPNPIESVSSVGKFMLALFGTITCSAPVDNVVTITLNDYPTLKLKASTVLP